jgi:hypothetical protein
VEEEEEEESGGGEGRRGRNGRVIQRLIGHVLFYRALHSDRAPRVGASDPVPARERERERERKEEGGPGLRPRRRIENSRVTCDTRILARLAREGWTRGRYAAPA